MFVIRLFKTLVISISIAVSIVQTCPKTSEVSCCGGRYARIYDLYSLRPPRRTMSTTRRPPVRAVRIFRHLDLLATKSSLVLGLAGLLLLTAAGPAAAQDGLQEVGLIVQNRQLYAIAARENRWIAIDLMGGEAVQKSKTAKRGWPYWRAQS